MKRFGLYMAGMLVVGVIMLGYSHLALAEPSSGFVHCADGTTAPVATGCGSAGVAAGQQTNNCDVATGTPGLKLDCSNGKNPIYALLTFAINWIIRILVPLAVLAIIISGIQYIVSQGNPDAIKSAKSHLFNAIIGLVLLLVMGVILQFLGVAQFLGGK